MGLASGTARGGHSGTGTRPVHAAVSPPPGTPDPVSPERGLPAALAQAAETGLARGPPVPSLSPRNRNLARTQPRAPERCSRPGPGPEARPGSRAGLTFVLQVHQNQQEREHRAQPAAHRAGGHHVQGRLSRRAGRCAAQQPAQPTAGSEAPAVRSLGQRSGLSGGWRPAAENSGGRGPRTPHLGRRRRPIAFFLATERPSSPGSWLALIGYGGWRPAPPLIG